MVRYSKVALMENLNNHTRSNHFLRMVDQVTNIPEFSYLTVSDSGDCSVSHLGREGKGHFGWARSVKGTQGRRDASSPAFSFV